MKIKFQMSRILRTLRLDKELTTEEVTERISGLNYYQVYSRLKNLEELGEIKGIKKGDKIFWRRNGTS